MLEMIPKCFWLTISRELKVRNEELKEMAIAEQHQSEAKRRDRRIRINLEYDQAIHKKLNANINEQARKRKANIKPTFNDSE